MREEKEFEIPELKNLTTFLKFENRLRQKDGPEIIQGTDDHWTSLGSPSISNSRV